MNCVICNEIIIPSITDQGGYGYNPAPVKMNGRCCEVCDQNIVIPTRIEDYINRGKI